MSDRARKQGGAKKEVGACRKEVGTNLEELQMFPAGTISATKLIKQLYGLRNKTTTFKSIHAI